MDQKSQSAVEHDLAQQSSIPAGPHPPRGGPALLQIEKHQKIKMTPPSNKQNWLLLSLLLALASTASYYLLDPLQQNFAILEDLPADVLSFFEYLSAFGHGTGVVICMGLVLTLDSYAGKRALVILIASLTTGAVCLGMKSFFHRIRPSVLMKVPLGPVDQGTLLDSTIQSFPSGHTASAFALATLLAHSYPRGKMVFYFLAVVTAFQRVFSNQHYFSDVFAGAAIGLTVASLVLCFCQTRCTSSSSEILPVGIGLTQ